ncbi:hypothetical protein E3J49_00165 [Candidatus Bathyarchaeota archaeon]|nr:MAG: hypothetical protein E3J49_00165 [Candidatus Bathyarchaeota archaeon]
MRRATSVVMVVLLSVSMFVLTSNIHPVKASGTIYIRADGSIYPPTTNIVSADNITCMRAA